MRGQPFLLVLHLIISANHVEDKLSNTLLQGLAPALLSQASLTPPHCFLPSWSSLLSFEATAI